MNKLFPFILIPLSLITLFISIQLFRDNTPIIGIVANPDPDNDDTLTRSIIYITYIRWLENAGAKVIPILPWYTEGQIDDIFSKINGVLMMGGDRDLNLSNKWEGFNQMILNKLIEKNENGIRIPLFGICQAFEMIPSLLINDVSILESFDAWEIMMNLPISEKQKTNSKMYRSLSLTEEALNENRVTVHYHRLGISPETVLRYEKLKAMLSVTATGEDRNKKKFVNSFEGKKHEIYLVQYHPEKDSLLDVEKDKDEVEKAKLFSKELADFFINRARNTLAFNKMSVKEYGKYKVFDTLNKPPVEGIKPLPVYVFENIAKHLKK